MVQPTPPTVAPRVPTLVVVVAASIVVFIVGLTLVGAYEVGITWDEKTNMQSLQVFFDQGWNITADALIDGRPNPAYIWGTYVYGPVSLLFTHLVSSALGTEQWGRISFSAEAYAIRHVAGALIGVAGIAATGLIVRIVTGSWRWAVLGAAVIASIPMWTGHSMMNIKDMPVGTGYTVATLGLVLMMRRNFPSVHWVRFTGPLLVLLGALLAAGTRAASGIPIAGSVVFASIAWWLINRRNRDLGPKNAFRGAVLRLAVGLLSLIGTYLVMVLVYPNVWRNPFALAYQAGVVSAKFPFNEPIKFAGMWVDQPVPWTYLPGWFFAQLPLLALVGAIGFGVFWIWRAGQAIFSGSDAVDRGLLTETAPVMLQALLLPVVAVVVQTTMYNGVRQFLFVAPAVAVLATLGVWRLVRACDGARRPVLGVVVWVAVVLGLIAPAFAQARLFPYQYAYYNAVTALRPIDNTWPTDYWRASSNEIMRRLPAVGLESCAYEQTRKGTAMPCANEPMFEPYLTQRGTDALSGTLPSGHYWLVRENQGRTTIPDGCTLHDAITRPLFWQTVTIAQIFDCSSEAKIPANGD